MISGGDDDDDGGGGGDDAMKWTEDKASGNLYKLQILTQMFIFISAIETALILFTCYVNKYQPLCLMP